MTAPWVLCIVQALCATGALLSMEAVPDFQDWTTTIERLGLAVALVIFFVSTNWYSSWQREKRMGKRIDYLEKQVASLSGRLAAVNEQVTETIRRDSEMVVKVMETLANRTCWAFENHEDYVTFKEWLKEHHQANGE